MSRDKQMGKHLDRLGGDADGHPCRVFSIEKHPDGTFEIWEECDRYFSEKFTAEELRELAAEIVAVSRS